MAEDLTYKRAVWSSKLLPGIYGNPSADGLRVTLHDGWGIAAITARKGQAAVLARMLTGTSAHGCSSSKRTGLAAGDLGHFVGTGPDTWFVYSATYAHESLAERLQEAFSPIAAIADQCDARLIMSLSGPAARHVLAKGIPIDLHDRVFGEGDAVVTAVRDIGVHLWHAGSGPAYGLSCPRSTADSFWLWLTDAAGPTGCRAVLQSSQGGDAKISSMFCS